MEFTIRGNQFLKNGTPIKIISGAVHYFRNLPDTWDDIFEKMVACGFNTVETYCPWNMHEKVKGEFDFSAQYDISLFLSKAKEHGLMAIVRPGPYICAEWEFGGLPWWLHAEKDTEIRCLNKSYIIFDVKGKPCNTFLRMYNFKKGFAILNGFNLGRYWEIGPQKALYVPFSLLKEGKNELILFESDGLVNDPIVEFVDKPDLG